MPTAFLRTIALLLPSLLSLTAVEYYVSSSGDDDHSGTSIETAWRTIDRVNAGVYHGGDTILFEGGQTFSGALVMGPENWGAAPVPDPDQMVAFGSYGNGRATIDSGNAAGWSSQDIGAFSLSDLIFVGGGTSTTTANGCWIYSTLPEDTHLPAFHLRNLDISGYGSCGIFSWADNTGAGWDDIVIADCVIHDCTAGVPYATAGIQILGANFGEGWTRPAYRNPTVTNNHVYDNPGRADSTQPTSGSGICVGQSSGGSIQYNEVHDNGANNTFNPGPMNIWIHDSIDLVVQFNESYRARTGRRGVNAAAGISMDVHCKDCIAQYNYCYDNEGPGIQVMAYSEGVTPFRTNEGTVIRYNITRNNGTRDNYPSEILLISAGGFAPSTISGVQVYNNTCYSTGRPCLLFAHVDFANTTGRVCNNVFYATGGARFVHRLHQAVPPAPAQFLMAGNTYYTTGSFRLNWGGTNYTQMSAWRNATGQETLAGQNTAQTGDPRLVDPGLDAAEAYRLQAGSPCIDAGLDLAALFAIDPGPRDYFGNAIGLGGGWDVGAHEFVPATGAEVLRFEAMSMSVAESGSEVIATVRRSGSLQGSVSVDYATMDGTAHQGTDYIGASGTLTFLDGQDSASFPVVIEDDDDVGDDEPNETIILSLSNPTGAEIGAPATSTVTILDDDQLAGSLVVDGGLETGDFAPWYVFGDTSIIDDPALARGGSKRAVVSGESAGFCQDVFAGLVAGETYEVTFWYRLADSGSVWIGVGVTAETDDGEKQVDEYAQLTDTATWTPVHFTYTLPEISTASWLWVWMTSAGPTLEIDDVSVVPVPVPGGEG